MSFEERGFLSLDLDKWREKVRAKFAPRLVLLDDISDVAQRALYQICELPQSPENLTKNLLTCALLVRLLQLLQGLILCIERGMITNARTLLRSGLETLFFFGASIQREDFSKIAMQDHKFQQDKLFRMQIEAIRSGPPDDKLVQALDRAHQDVMEQLKAYEKKGVSFRDVAIMADLGEAYDTYYRGLSTDAAHVNMWSIVGIFNPEGGIKFGPGEGNYPDTLNVAIVLGSRPSSTRTS